MIVSSIGRCGSTKFCYDLAKQLKVPLYDEILNMDIKKPLKHLIHEMKVPEHNPKNPAFLRTIDFDRAVINNHSINFFNLQKTNIFLTRENVQDSFWSFVEITKRYFAVENPKLKGDALDSMIRQILQRELVHAQFFYEYCYVYNVQLVIPDLKFTDSKVYRERYEQFTNQIENFKEKIKLPSYLRYE